MSFGSRMRLVLGGDDLYGGADELPAATMGAISSVLGCDLDDDSGGAISLVLGCDETGAIWGWGRCGCDETGASSAISLLFLSLSSIFLRWKSFEGKIKPENELRVRQGILQSTRKMNSI